MCVCVFVWYVFVCLLAYLYVYIYKFLLVLVDGRQPLTRTTFVRVHVAKHNFSSEPYTVGAYAYAHRTLVVWRVWKVRVFCISYFDFHLFSVPRAFTLYDVKLGTFFPLVYSLISFSSIFLFVCLFACDISLCFI